ncbi:MAG: DUF4190 domain-containing protein [Terriglobales bacterium]
MANCAHCGTANADDAGYCQKCGQPLETSAIPSLAAPTPAPAARTSPLAIASLILSFFSLFPMIGILAVVFGHISRAQIRKSAGQLKGSGMALAGLILGYGGIAFLVFLLVVSLPEMMMVDRPATNESSAVGSLRTLNTSAITYAATYPKRGFPTTLAQMGPPVEGAQPDEDHAYLIEAVLASGERSGYRFTYVSSDTNRDGITDAYAAHADPLAPGTGKRHFFTDESGVIRFESGRPAGPNSPVLN